MKSPLLGYNTNVRHHGKTFHIQTEDSGTSHAHIFTHLFADGGRILATKKTTYAQWIGTDRYPGVVKKLMQAQHKAMFIALRDGLFDQDEVAGAKAFSEREIVLEDEATLPTPPGGSSPAAAPKSAPVDVDALERAAAAFEEQARTYEPPPPATAASPAQRRPLTPFAGTPAAPAASPSRARLDPTPVSAISTSSRPSAAGGPGRYQETQPAASRPRASKPAAAKAAAAKASDSLFGADILSEKSLDEVIMSYLAEDLDEKE
jgi:hypothetical protein